MTELTERPRSRVALRIVEDSARERLPRVSAKRFAAFVESLQNALYAVAEYVDGHIFRSRGQVPSFVRRNCELHVHEIKMGSLFVELALDEDQARLDDEHLGARALKNLAGILGGLEGKSRDFSNFDEIVDDPRYQIRILRTLKDLMPLDGESFSVEIAAGLHQVTFREEHRKRVREILSDTAAQVGDFVVKGRLIELHVKRPMHMKMQDETGNIIFCSIEEEMIDDANDLLGYPVVVGGKGQFDESGRLSKLHDIHALDPLALDFVRSFAIEATEFALEKPLKVSVEWEDDVWLISCAEPRIVAYGDSYHEAIEAFRENLALLYAEYALEEEHVLDRHAVELKRILNSLVRSHD